MTIPGAAESMGRLAGWARRWATLRRRVVRAAATVMSLAGVGLLMASSLGTVFAYAASSSKTPATDSCGYPNSSTARAATVFNENTVTRAMQVYGSGLTARIAVFSNDENGVLLGVNGATPFTGSLHVSNPSLGDTSSAANDPSGRPQYPALFITDVTTSSSSTAGDWQQGGAPVNFVSDVYGTWVTATVTSGNYQRSALPTKNHWNLGPGSDVPSSGFAALGDEGYGTEFSWNVSALGLSPGNTYRIQVMTHDGDQNRSGGDVGEVCTKLTIPGNPPLPAVHIDKTNNAAGTGFAKQTTAAAAAMAVPFQLAVTNSSSEPEKVTALTDSYSGQVISPACTLPGGGLLVGSTLAAGQSVTCTFTLPGYSPPAGQSLTDTVSIQVTDTAGHTATDTSTSTVTTPSVPVVTQTIAGSILLCDSSGKQTTTTVNGGAIRVLSGGQTVLGSSDQLPPASIPAGTYTMTATAPAGYQFTACGATGVTISSPTAASQAVTVPSGGSGSGVFYVTAVPIVGVIDKTNNAAGTGYGKVEQAPAPGRDVPFRAVITNNSPVPVIIDSLSDAWPGQTAFSPTCAHAVVGQVLAPNGGSTTCDFTIASYSPPSGEWIVDTVTAKLSQFDVQSNSAVLANSSSVTSTSTVGTAPATSPATNPPPNTQPPATLAPATVPPAPAPSTPATPSLAFTGPPKWAGELFAAGLGLISVGFFFLWLTRPRPLRPTDPA